MQPKPSSPRLTDNISTEIVSLDQVMRADRHRLRRLKNQLTDEAFKEQVKESVERRKFRESLSPRIQYPPDLPITNHQDSLIQLIRDHQVLVVCGETGSGKSTQLPKLCLEAGLGRQGIIGHTQPRRLAARSIASRLADELHTKIGDIVGYKVRFGDQTGPNTLVKLMTDGILLAETQTDRFLDHYDAIIIDEAHERSLNIDFLLGYLKQLLSRRADLKIIITSATIDAERFANHFDDEKGPAPIVTVEGRGFPVEIQYLPWDSIDENTDRQYQLSQHVIAGLELAAKYGGGDTLVFLPTERDIREVSHQVSGHYKRLGLINRYDLLPLYARLPQSHQQKIFQPDGSRQRVIFATNVAESSLTVPGIRYVIDGGTARISRYNPRLKVQRLPIEPVSQASANQRAGRCGRLGPGVCFRLYSEEDFDSREPYTTPEIRRANLASVILQMKALKLGRIEDFPLLDAPNPTAISDGFRTLTELNAVDERRELTALGLQIARLPVDPRVARILIEAQKTGCLAEILPIAAALEIQDPRERPPEKQQAADENHSEFTDPQSDFLSLLRLWKHYNELRENLSRNKLEKSLRRRFLSPNRMREWSDVYRQLKEMMTRPTDKAISKTKASRRLRPIRYEPDNQEIVSDDLYRDIHQSLLTGLLSGVALAGEKNGYAGAGGLKLFLWPGSGVFSSKPKWIVASELIETSKQYARTVGKINPAWVESAAQHLVKRSYSDPHWSKKSGGAFCYEAQYMFGLPIVVKRRVPLGPIDPETARDLLIEHGLTEQLIRTNAKFYRHNLSLLQAISDLAAKTRRRDLVIDDHRVARLYQERLPSDVADRSSLERLDREIKKPSWFNLQWKADQVLSVELVNKQTDSPDALYFSPADLLEDKFELAPEDFPDFVQIDGSDLPLVYNYSPGSDSDGIKIKVHQSAVNQLSQGRLDWMVPGLFVSKLNALIKSLPKRIRRNLVPSAEVANQVAEELMGDYSQTPFLPTVCEVFSKIAGMKIYETDFQQEKIDDYFQFLVAVVNDEGKELAASRDLVDLQKQFRSTKNQIEIEQKNVQSENWSRSEVTSFDIEMIPEFITQKRGGVNIRLYPGWVDHGTSVSTTLYNNPDLARQSFSRGMTRLFLMADHKEIRSQIRYLPGLNDAKIKLADVMPSSDLESILGCLLCRIAFVDNEPVVRERSEFDRRRSDAARRISIAAQDLSQWLDRWVDSHFGLRRILEDRSDFLRQVDPQGTIADQIKWLYCGDFTELVPWCWLIHYPRYLETIRIKIDRLSTQSDRISKSQEIIDGLWRRWLGQFPEDEKCPERQCDSEFRWMIEELRVSLFAQSLGTSIKVSPQRCEKLLLSL